MDDRRETANAGAAGKPSSRARELCGAGLRLVLHHFLCSRRPAEGTMIVVIVAQQLPYNHSDSCRTLARRGENNDRTIVNFVGIFLIRKIPTKFTIVLSLFSPLLARVLQESL